MRIFGKLILVVFGVVIMITALLFFVHHNWSVNKKESRRPKGLSAL